MKLPQRSNERPLKTSEVRLKGDYAHNNQVIHDKKGTLLVANTHIPGEGKDASPYLACPDCKSWVLTEDLASHRCIYTKSDVASRVRRGMQILEAELRKASRITYSSWIYLSIILDKEKELLPTRPQSRSRPPCL
jgi:hypothetical protein